MASSSQLFNATAPTAAELATPTPKKRVEPPSKRWLHFHSALQLAIQRVAHKWTYEDFAECFSAVVEGDKDADLTQLHTTISRYMESMISTSCEQLLEKYNARENIDTLHSVVTEARAHKAAGGSDGEGNLGPDVWRENLHPKAAVRARTVPVLEEEVKRLKESLAELENNNRELQLVMQENVRKREEADQKATQLLDTLVEVHAKWDELPLEQIQEWALIMAETMSTSRPP
ncbi:hypothetical protein JAAARDRAFT_42096 [Jaapia argillacea MUCL 33604]|uniref:Kinetochore-associated protein NNF1 n=1 Tax=Jaapia argillacea MUCL 33604 TaxID=933084 RepID=A0A067P6S1_9AGAM|nr:hypothetical protein JAAARDRAFT_42096 [Jaapia argillacea MUCL 33604]